MDRPGYISRLIKSAVFPRFCASCKAEGTLLCSPCASAWQPKPITSPQLVSSFNYADPIARELIRAWKYSLDATAWAHLQRKLGPAIDLLRSVVVDHAIEAIIPVPLHKQRKLERGFDQAEEIGTYLSEVLDVPMCPLLIRSRTTGSQTDREMSDRVRAMEDSPFRMRDDHDVPKRLLIVDDVYTTGATAKAAAQVLMNAGAEEIHFYTLAKGG